MRTRSSVELTGAEANTKSQRSLAFVKDSSKKTNQNRPKPEEEEEIKKRIHKIV